MSDKEELFKGTSFSDLMSDVYHNSKKKDRQISQLIAQLHPLIKTVSDATIVVPLIKEYLDVAVKNDDHLVKLTAIAQRYISTTQTVTAVNGLSDDEKKQLLDIASKTFEDELTDELTRIETNNITEKINNAKEQVNAKNSN